MVDVFWVNSVSFSNLVKSGDFPSIFQKPVLHAKDRLFQESEFFLKLSVRLLIALFDLIEKVDFRTFLEFQRSWEFYFAFLSFLTLRRKFLSKSLVTRFELSQFLLQVFYVLLELLVLFCQTFLVALVFCSFLQYLFFFVCLQVFNLLL